MGSSRTSARSRASSLKTSSPRSRACFPSAMSPFASGSSALRRVSASSRPRPSSCKGRSTFIARRRASSSSALCSSRRARMRGSPPLTAAVFLASARCRSASSRAFSARPSACLTWASRTSVLSSGDFFGEVVEVACRLLLVASDLVEAVAVAAGLLGPVRRDCSSRAARAISLRRSSSRRARASKSFCNSSTRVTVAANRSSACWSPASRLAGRPLDGRLRAALDRPRPRRGRSAGPAWRGVRTADDRRPCRASASSFSIASRAPASRSRRSFIRVPSQLPLPRRAASAA